MASLYFEQIFGWVSKDNSDKLRFVEIVLLIARKNGKSFMLSGIALFKILFGDHGEEIYSLATKKDQAKIVWETAVNQSQVMDKSFKRLLKSTTTRLSNQSKMAFYAFVGKDSTTLDGLNPSTTIIDEASMISDRNLIEVFESAIGARLSPQIIYISTASFSRDTLFFEKLQHLKNTLDGVVKDERLFGMVYSVDENDDWIDKKNWIKANPNLGVSIQEDYLQRQVELALTTTTRKNQVKVKHFNIFTDGIGNWISRQAWENCGGKIKKKGRCFVGLDLSATKDLTAITRLWTRNDGIIHADFKCWIPKKTYKELPKHYKSIFKYGVDSGVLHVVEGQTIDYKEIAGYMDATYENYDVEAFAYDNWNASMLIKDFEEKKYPMLAISQSMKSLSAPTKELELKVLNKKFIHENNAFINWTISNCQLYQDVNNNVKIVKDDTDTHKKIDPIIALLIAFAVADDQAEDERESGISVG